MNKRVIKLLSGELIKGYPNEFKETQDSIVHTKWNGRTVKIPKTSISYDENDLSIGRLFKDFVKIILVSVIVALMFVGSGLA